jgi:TetR/AcrR family transcriptional repressor of nem operon
MEKDRSVPKDRTMTKGEQTRQKIVAAAAPIFNQRGYEGSSMSDLMAATGLKKGGIYRHFTNKEELAAQAFDYTWNAAWDLRVKNLDERSRHLDKLKQLIENFVELRSAVAGGCPVLNTAVDADDGNPVLRKRVSKALKSWSSLIETIVERAIKAGETRPGVDAQNVATLVIASLEGAFMMSRIEGTRDSLRRIKKYLLDYIEQHLASISAA